MDDVHDGIPVPPTTRGATQKARQLKIGQCRDVPTAAQAAVMVQAIKGFRNKTGYQATQRKLLHDGRVNKTKIVPIGEWFWRVWRMS